MAKTNPVKILLGTVYLLVIPLVAGLIAGWAHSGDHSTLALATGVMFGFAFGLSLFMVNLAPRGAGTTSVDAFMKYPTLFITLWSISILVLYMMLAWLYVPNVGLPLSFSDPDWLANDVPIFLAFSVALIYLFVVGTMYLFAIATGSEFDELGKKFGQQVAEDKTWDASTFKFINNTIRWTGVAILLMFFVLIVATSWDVIDGTVSLSNSMKLHEDAPLEGMLDFFAQTKIVMFLFLGWSVAVLIAFVGNITGGTGPKAMTLFSLFALLYFVMVFNLHEPFMDWVADDFVQNGFAATLSIISAGILFFFISNFIAASVITLFLLSFSGTIKAFKSFRREDVYKEKGYARFVTQISTTKKHSVNRNMKRKLGRK